LPRLTDVVTQTFKSISPGTLSERLFRDPLERWWETCQQKLEETGYDGPVQMAFFIASFTAMGHVAKCNGRVKAVEVELATKVMEHLKLSKKQKQLAIRLFNEGKHTDFALDTLLWRFKRQCHHRVSVLQIFIEIQLQMACADSVMDASEAKLIKRMCKRLDVSDSIYIRIERRVRAEKKARQQVLVSRPGKAMSLSDACEVLGVGRWTKPEQVKKAYRSMMGLHHPDKLQARGASEIELIESQEIVCDIKSAYEILMNARRIR